MYNYTLHITLNIVIHEIDDDTIYSITEDNLEMWK